MTVCLGSLLKITKESIETDLIKTEPYRNGSNEFSFNWDFLSLILKSDPNNNDKKEDISYRDHNMNLSIV